MFLRYNKIIIFFSILVVVSFYFFLAKSFFQEKYFFPEKTYQIYSPCGNFYNLLVDSLKHKKVNILEDIDISFLRERNPYSNYSSKYSDLLDTSYYKGKIYLYFGITPVLLFYLPFNLITGLYLTDKFLIFILSCFSFLLSMTLFSIMSYKKETIFRFLTVFLIGFCSLLPFILIRSFIYETVIITANVLLLFSFIVFYYVVTIINSEDAGTQLNNMILNSFSFGKETKDILIFILGMLLSLCVGARPQYVLFIPIFLFAICLLNYYKVKNIKYLFRQAVVFLIPCAIIGIILALYNYLRFDSIFNFGWKYQLNNINQYEYVVNLKDLWIGFTHNLFQLPDINEKTIFSLSKTTGHSIGNEHIVGIVWTCPIILILLFLPNFFKNVYKENKNIFTVSVVMFCVIVINIIVASLVGMTIRYLFECLSLMLILSILMFNYYVNKTIDRSLKIFLNILFVAIVVYSIFINMSLLFCQENFIIRPLYGTAAIKYSKLVSFLF